MKPEPAMQPLPLITIWTKAIHRSLVLTPLLAGVLSINAPAASNAVHQATGLKICEVDDQSAIIWTRLTRHAAPVSVDGGRCRAGIQTDEHTAEREGLQRETSALQRRRPAER